MGGCALWQRCSHALWVGLQLWALSAILAAGLTVSAGGRLFGTVDAAEPPPADVPAGHWTYSVVESLIDRRLVPGLGEEILRPDHTLSRYEMAWFLGKALDWMGAAASAQPPHGPALDDVYKLARSYNQRGAGDRLTSVQVEQLAEAVMFFRDELSALGYHLDGGVVEFLSVTPGLGTEKVWQGPALRLDGGPGAAAVDQRRQPEAPAVGAAMRLGEVELSARLQPGGAGAKGLSKVPAALQALPGMGLAAQSGGSDEPNSRTGGGGTAPWYSVPLEAIVTAQQRQLDLDELRTAARSSARVPNLSVGVEVPITRGSLKLGYSLAELRWVGRKTTDFGLEYRLSPEVSVLLGYKLVDFAGDVGDQRARVASAQFAMRF